MDLSVGSACQWNSDGYGQVYQPQQSVDYSQWNVQGNGQVFQSQQANNYYQGNLGGQGTVYYSQMNCEGFGQGFQTQTADNYYQGNLGGQENMNYSYWNSQSQVQASDLFPQMNLQNNRQYRARDYKSYMNTRPFQPEQTVHYPQMHFRGNGQLYQLQALDCFLRTERCYTCRIHLYKYETFKKAISHNLVKHLCGICYAMEHPPGSCFDYLQSKMRISFMI